jgi:hypothetical protein
MTVQTNAAATRAGAASATTTAEAAVVALLFAAGFAWLFRRWLFTGFDGIFGDEGDGEILIALLEHWHRALAGTAHLADPSFFYPQTGTLGFTDAYLLYGIAFAALRSLGADTFTAFMIVMAALAAIGFFGFLRLARRHFAVPTLCAAVGAFLFAFANMNAVKLVQAQAYCAMLLPVLCDLALSAWICASRRRGMLLAAAAGLLHAAILSTAYLTGWFFTAFGLLIAVLYPVAFGFARTMALVREAAAGKRHVVLAYLLAFAVGIVPFLAIYLPVVQSGHRRELAEILSNAPDARDILNVTTGNWLWGELLRWLGISGRPDRPVWEVELGFTPTMLVVMATAIVVLALRIFTRREATADRDRFALVLGLAAIVSWLIQLDYFGLRPWRLVHAVLPGASGVRYSFRSQIVANLFAALVVARALEYLKLRHSVLAAGCAGLLMLEQTNVDWPATISRRAKTAWIAGIAPAPAACGAFYLVPGASPTDKPWWEHQADAMLFSQIRGMPTINGYSSWLPDGWALEEPSRPGYAAAVRAWAAARKVEGLCGLDPGRGTWVVGLPQ